MKEEKQIDANKPIKMKVRQAYTGVWFFWNGLMWVCERNSNVKISDEDMEYDLVMKQ